MNNESGRNPEVVLKRMLQFVMLLGVLFSLGIIGILHLNKEIAQIQLVKGVASLFVFFFVAYKGIDIALDDILDSLELIREYPELLTFNFFSILIFPLLLILLIGLTVSLGSSIFSIILLSLGWILIVFVAMPMASKISEGAITLYLSDPSNSVESAYIGSIGYLPVYYMIWWYEILAKWAVNSFIGRKLLFGLTSVPSFAIGSMTDVSTSYSTIIAVSTGKSASKSVAESMKTTISDAPETSFLELGAFIIILVLTAFMAVPLGVSMFLVSIIEPQTFTNLLFCGIPFLTGLIGFIAVSSATYTSKQVALIRNYSLQ